jgi:hypothetical protein
LLDRGRHFVNTGEAERAASTFASALGLWRGSPFDELDCWGPGRNEAARLEELRRSAEEDLLEVRLAAGEHRHVVADAELCVAEEPLRERRWAMLATAQYRCGRQGDALRSLRQARRTLVEELGVAPGLELGSGDSDPRSRSSARRRRCPQVFLTLPVQGAGAYSVRTLRARRPALSVDPYERGSPNQGGSASSWRGDREPAECQIGATAP